jgi:predicted GIY-YIG superfamily endonuclease
VSRVYLIHIEPPFRQAGHYVGYTTRDDVMERIAEHVAGRGARLCRHAVAAGSTLVLARVWQDAPRRFEVRLKRTSQRMLCPICNPSTAMNRRRKA